MTTKVPVELSSTPGIVDNSDATAITIDSSENVGIGSTSPDSKLHVESTGVTTLRIRTSSSSSEPQMLMIDGAGDYFSMQKADRGMTFKPQGAEAMRIDDSGDVGIGTSSPDKVLTVADNGSNCAITLYKSPDGSINSAQKVLAMGTGSSTNNTGTSGGTEHSILSMYHNGTEEIRLYTQGNSYITNNLAIGVAGTSTKLYVQGDTASSYLAIFYHDGNDNNRYGMRILAGSDTATDGQIWMRFDDGDGHAQGYIQHSSGTVLVGQSDERLKENIIDSPLEGINTLKQIQQREFNWKKDINKTKTIGYIAQELETVYPAAVTTVSDDSGEGVVAPDDDPDNPYKFVAKERLIDVLIKATQEQQVIIEDLKSRIETLETAD